MSCKFMWLSVSSGNSLSLIDGQKFSTFDKDQDTWVNNCARSFLAGFWYSDCHDANPNGVYLWGADSTLYAIGVEWISWKGRGYSLKAISMKIRPVQWAGMGLKTRQKFPGTPERDFQQFCRTWWKKLGESLDSNKYWRNGQRHVQPVRIVPLRHWTQKELSNVT